MKRCFLSGIFVIAFIVAWQPVASQEIYHPVSGGGVYDLIDELSAAGVISVNSAVRPLTRKKISLLLAEASEKRETLWRRVLKELDFYLNDFYREAGMNPPGKKRLDLYYYSDSLFSFTVNPILGGELFLNSSGTASYWRNGAEVRAYAGKWGFYGSLRDNHEKPLLGLPEYLTPRSGGHIKNATDWSEMRGGVTWSWKWGYVGLIKDQQIWGTNYNGANIFGGNNPTFVSLRLHLNPAKWFEFDYMHGWLNSMVVDSARSYYVNNSYGTDYREVYHGKYLAANMFTFTPVNKLYVSVGNSIVYSDIGFHPAYLVPLFFYKSVDHSVNSGIDNMNSQMYFNVSTYQVRNLHIYASCFIDELSVSRIFRDNEWNFISWKTGFRLFNTPFRNITAGAEFTYTYPLTYMHYVPTLSFESNNYNLGHWLKDNSREIYADIVYRPLKSLRIKIWGSDAIRGDDYTSIGGPRVGNPPLASVVWHNRSIGVNTTWQPFNDLYLTAALISNNITGKPEWTPVYFSGNRTTLSAGLTFGF
jgi:hypothetical protein